jgi:PLP dependent protein
VTSVDQHSVAERLADVRARVVRAGGRDITIMAVTKGFGADAIAAAAAAGLHDVGENYAQELLGKLPAVPSPAIPFSVTVHFIGRLQSNKIRQLVPVVDVFQTIDRASLIDELARRRPGARMMVQVNVSDEPQKGGCPPGDTSMLVEAARTAGLTVEGLMTVGRTGSPSDAAAGFALLRQLADRAGVRHCSMGMTDDLEAAVAEGSTMIRVGSALFGSRPG